MRRLKYLVASTLDGKIARLDGSFDFFSAAGDAHVPDYFASLREFDAVLMGRKTYEVGCPWALPILIHFSIANTHGAAGSPTQFKQRDAGDIYLCGGARLASTLLEAGLIDEIVVKLNPLLLGDGLPLFATIAKPTLLGLVSTKSYENGVLLLSYRLNGDRA